MQTPSSPSLPLPKGCDLSSLTGSCTLLPLLGGPISCLVLAADEAWTGPKGTGRGKGLILQLRSQGRGSGKFWRLHPAGSVTGAEREGASAHHEVLGLASQARLSEPISKAQD